jgi:DNA-binding MarR family transcriptional regulator
MPTHCLCTSVRQLARRITSIYETHLEPHGVSAPQFSILQRLHLLGPIANLEFASEMGMDKSTLSRGLKPLITQGWVRTVVMPEGAVIDKRSFGLQLTESGTAKYWSTYEAWTEAQEQMQALLGKKLASRLLSTTLDAYQTIDHRRAVIQ